jgi:hypothetical protein
VESALYCEKSGQQKLSQQEKNPSVFAVVGDTCSNSVYSRPAATESSLIRKRLTVLSSEIVYSRPLAASESSFILTAAVISSKSSTLALYLRLPFFPPKYCAIHCPLSLICW